ncbi:hypothetical protein [Pedobacter sp. UBA5917]|uniref:hypothetical protein n=1 Tax=Pedobacter sp. UBA5917 TaxID=1947061 RepID=UPI0025E0CFAC|nr:hypothetical protein [Pedobacter sp. UBA5917]
MMKNILMVILLITTYCSTRAQEKKPVSYITNNALIGVWQKGSKIVGSGIDQHFVFSKDGRFILNLYSEGDDARSLIRLKGKYRLVKDELYLTILSKVFVEGELEIGSEAITSSLLQFGTNSKIREVKVPNPKEISDPCYITVISRTNIKLNNQVYYKIK